MYKEIGSEYISQLPDFPRMRRPRIGTIIKAVRIDKGIRQKDFAKQIDLNESTLKSIENDHQQATTVENLDRCAQALGMTLDQVILLGREYDPANYFLYKRKAPPAVRGIRKRKRFPEEWRESIRLRFKNFDCTPISPPLAVKKDFFFCRINLPPKRTIEKLCLNTPGPVMGLISEGFNIKIRYAGSCTALTGNQGFALEGSKPHEIINDDEDHAAVIYLLTRVAGIDRSTPGRPSREKELPDLRVAAGIEKIRKVRSQRPGRPLSVNHMADLTDSLNHEQIIKMMRIKKGSSVIYWEKIEDLLAGTRVTMEDFLLGCRGLENPGFSVATAATRPVIDYSTYHGIKIHSVTPPNLGHAMFCGQILMEAPGKTPAKPWHRKDQAMIGVYVEEGEMEITVGRNRSPMTLIKGESLYFDGDLGYSFRNPAAKQAKGILASCPGLAF